MVDKTNGKTFGHLKENAQCSEKCRVVHKTCLWTENLTSIVEIYVWPRLTGVKVRAQKLSGAPGPMRC